MNNPNSYPGGPRQDPTLSSIERVTETMGGSQGEAGQGPIIFETADGPATLEECILRIIRQIEADETNAEVSAAGARPADRRTQSLRHLEDYDVIDLDTVPDSPNALYVATAEDLRALLRGTYDVLGFTEGMFAGLGISRDQFIDSIVAHEEDHAAYARRIRRPDVRFSMLVRPAQGLDLLAHGPSRELAGYEPVVQVDLGGQITKLEYAAILVGADPSAEDRARIRRIFGYSSVREVIARIQHHNRDALSPFLPVPEWFEEWQRSA